MKNLEINNRKIAILSTSGFEESELVIPYEKLKEAGANVDIISDQPEIKSWQHGNWGIVIKSDIKYNLANVDDYDALVLPGGVINPDKLRRNQEIIDFVRKFGEKGKLIAAICHGPQLLIDAELVNEKELTSFYSIKNDLMNAGANWIDEEVVQYENLITSRKPDDIPAFVTSILNYLTSSQ